MRRAFDRGGWKAWKTGGGAAPFDFPVIRVAERRSALSTIGYINLV